MTTTAITTTTAGGAIEPQNLDELRGLAAAAAATKFYGVSTPEQALLVLMGGRELGLSYVQSLRAFHLVQGKPMLSSSGMVAVCLRSEKCEYFRTVEASDTIATVEVKRRGDPPVRRSFTIEEAKRAGLSNRETWKAYPSRMLLARAQAFAAREVFPDILLGLYDPDEVPAAPVAAPVVAPVVVARAEPVRPVEVAIDVEPESTGYEDAIDAATTLEQLAAVGQDVAKSTLAAEDRAVLRGRFAAARKRILEMAARGVNLDAEDP